jgi:acyl-CoA synthetase (AMP-forming)/AMP-acid ligase II
VARPATPDAEVQRLVSCGRPIPGHRVTIIDEDGREVPEGHEGEIVFSGPSVAQGYHEAPEATAESFRGDGLHTGDLGLLLDGEVYVTGRVKDIVIVRGQNHHPHDVEWAASDDPDVRPGRVVAFGRPGPSGEEIVVALCARPGVDEAALTRRLRSRVLNEVGATVADVVFLDDDDLLKTSSGKLRRAAMRDRYLTGQLTGGAASRA